MSDRSRKARPDTLRRLFGRFAPKMLANRRLLLTAVSAMLVAALSEVVRPWPVKIVFDGLLIPQDQPDPVMRLARDWLTSDGAMLAAVSAAVLAIAIFGGFAAYAQSIATAAIGQRVVADIRLDLYRHVQRLSHSFHDTASTGDIITRLTGDVRLMQDLLVDTVLVSSGRVLVILGTIGVMALMDWRLTIVAVAVLPCLAGVNQLYGRRIKAAARQQRKKEGRIAVVMTEGISAISLVKTFAREAYEEDRFARQNQSSAEAGVHATRLAAQMERIVQILLAAGTCAVLWYGVIRVRADAISPGDLLVFTAYLTALYKPIRRMSTTTSRVAKAVASGERLLEILDLAPEVAEAPDAQPAPEFQGQIGFENLTFFYPRGGPVLEGANLWIEAGETLGLVGPSGRGKSSVAKLLMRFYDPQAGRVTIDGADIRKFTLDSLREQIAVVPQESLLFSTTVRDNIAYGRLDAADRAIEMAARLAGADDFIRRLPEGYDTILGERGATLSGGQRQRIAIARALVRSAPILVLDEPLTGLDRASAEDLVETLRLLARDRTVLLIAHDPLTLTLADRIVQIRDRTFAEVWSEEFVEARA